MGTQDPIQTPSEFTLLREIVAAIGAGDERRFQELRALKGVGAIEDPAPLPLP